MIITTLFVLKLLIMNKSVACAEVRGTDQDYEIAIKKMAEIEKEFMKLQIAFTTQAAEHDRKIMELDKAIMDQTIKILKQDNEILRMQNTLLEHTISQMNEDQALNDTIHNEVQQREKMQEALETKLSQIERNSNRIEEETEHLKLSHKMVKMQTEMNVTDLSSSLNTSLQIQANVERRLEDLLSNVIETNQTLQDIGIRQDNLQEKTDICDALVSQNDIEIQELLNTTKHLDLLVKQTTTAVENIRHRLLRDCQDVQDFGFSASGPYRISPGGKFPVEVFCELEADGGGWTVFQRRFDGSVDFYRDWNEYENGFGNLSGEHWLGNENIHRISSQGTYQLMIKLEDFSGNQRWAQYSLFLLGNKEENYRLSIGTYNGTAGDALSYHNNMYFSTKDRDNDLNPNRCANLHHGAWWYKSCDYSNLNGQYQNITNAHRESNLWDEWPGGKTNMKSSIMMIRKQLIP